MHTNTKIISKNTDKRNIFFIDRDGVINKEVGYLHNIEDFQFIDGVISSMQFIQSIGFDIIIITNQSGIGRGYYNESDFLVLNEWMLDELQKNHVHILNVLYCPHSPKDNCNCRKPRVGLIEEAENLYNINLSKSWLVGDKETDILLAKEVGIKNSIIVKSGHKIDEHTTQSRFILNSLSEVRELF